MSTKPTSKAVPPKTSTRKVPAEKELTPAIRKTPKPDGPTIQKKTPVRKTDIREKLFVDALLADPKLNSTKAAIKAGYSPNIARSCATTLLKKQAVISDIEKRRAKTQAAAEITQKMVVDELAKLGFANFGDYMEVGPNGDPTLNFSDLSRDQTAALTEVTVSTSKVGDIENKSVKFKLADKRAALVDIGKHLGMFTDKMEVTGKNGGPMAHTNVTPEELAQAVRSVRDQF